MTPLEFKQKVNGPSVVNGRSVNRMMDMYLLEVLQSIKKSEKSIDDVIVEIKKRIG